MVKFHHYRTSRYGDTGGFDVGTIADVELELEFEDTHAAHIPNTGCVIRIQIPV